MQSKILSNGIVYDNGKIVPWSVIFNALEQVAKANVIEKIREGINEKLSSEGGYNFEDDELICELAGVKFVKGYKPRLNKKLAKLNSLMESL